MNDTADKCPGNDDFLLQLDSCLTTYDVFQILKNVCTAFNFRDFIVRKLPGDNDDSLKDLIIISSWPSELLSAYDALSLMRTSPLFVRLRKTTAPFSWNIKDVAAQRTDETGVVARQLFESFGHKSGVHIPVSNTRGARIAVSFAGDRELVSRSELLELSYISTCVNDRLEAIDTSGPASSLKLTEREMECLSWTARGKTSYEISRILEISESTVNNYLSAVSKKLKCVNKTQAVAKAIFQGLLEPGDFI